MRTLFMILTHYTVILLTSLILIQSIYSKNYYEVNHLKKKNQIRQDLLVKIGGYLSWGDIANYYSMVSPYISVSWRGFQLSSADQIFTELEIGYFYMEGASGNIKLESHGLPITLSLVRPIKIGSNFELTPKGGLGFMPLFTSSTVKSSGTSNFFLLKPALTLSYNLNNECGACY